MKTTTYYRERNGDYLVIWPENGRIRSASGWLYEARATAIAGNVGSVQGTTVSSSYLRTCRRASLSDIPANWRRMLEGGAA